MTRVTTFVTRASAVPGSSAAASQAFAVQASRAAYTNVDIRVACAARPRIELAFGVQKVMHNGTREFVDVTGVQSTPTRTAGFVELAWGF
jgi:hypothetical protein